MNFMLISANALDNLWGATILSAYHLQNRIPHKRTGKTPYELWKGYRSNLKYLKVWGCLAKVLLPDPKKRKIGSKIAVCMLIGYAEHNVAYRFLVLKSDVLDSNIIIEIKNTEFFEHIFLLSDKIFHAPVERNSVTISNVEDLRRSKRPKKEYFSYENDFQTFLVENEPSNYSEAISSSDAKFWKEAIKIEIDSIMKSNT